MIEEKEYSLAWHYRKCEPVAVATTLNSLQTTISSLIRSMNLEVLNGKKVLEIKDNRVNKGYGASRFLNNEDFDFVLAAGDDTTDEDMFKVLPDHACSIKIGLDNTIAKYQVKSYKSLRRLLVKVIERFIRCRTSLPCTLRAVHFEIAVLPAQDQVHNKKECASRCILFCLCFSKIRSFLF